MFNNMTYTHQSDNEFLHYAFTESGDYVFEIYLN